MNRGGTEKRSQGFTIVETLIVLAVTSSLFVMAAIVINGRQQKTDFQVGIRNLQQQIQQVINETRSGYYPSSGTFNCSATAGSNVRLTAGSNTQGQNQDCTFVGKTLVVGGNSHRDNYTVYSLAGKRTLSNGDDVKLAKDANITAIAPSTVNPSSPDSAITTPIPNGLTYVWGLPVGGAQTANAFPLAFLSNFASFSGSDVTNQGGSQQIGLNGFSVQPTWSTYTSDANAINAEAAKASPYPAYDSGAQLCFKSGGTDQSGLITISSGLAVSYQIKSGTTCGA